MTTSPRVPPAAARMPSGETARHWSLPIFQFKLSRSF
jgi:hypothetical protein